MVCRSALRKSMQSGNFARLDDSEQRYLTLIVFRVAPETLGPFTPGGGARFETWVLVALGVGLILRSLRNSVRKGLHVSWLSTAGYLGALAAVLLNATPPVVLACIVIFGVGEFLHQTVAKASPKSPTQPFCGSSLIGRPSGEPQGAKGALTTMDSMD